MRCPTSSPGNPDGYIDQVCDTDDPRRSPQRGWPTRSMPSARASASAPAQVRRVARGGRRRTACRSSSTPSSFPTSTAPRSPPNSARSRPTISEHLDDAGVAAMAQAGTVAVLLPGGPITSPARRKPADRGAARRRRADGRRDCNPGTSPLTSPLLDDEHGRDPVPPDRGRMHLAGHDARSRARTRAVSAQPARLEAGQGAATWPSGTSSEPGRTRLPHGVQSAPCAHLEDEL